MKLDIHVKDVSNIYMDEQDEAEVLIMKVEEEDAKVLCSLLEKYEIYYTVSVSEESIQEMVDSWRNENGDR